MSYITAIEKKFFNLYWKDSICKSIFSLHESQLLEDAVELIVSKEKFYAQRIVLTNSKVRGDNNKIENRTENQYIELIHNIQITFNKYFDSEILENVILKKFGRTFNVIESELSNKHWLEFVFKIISSLQNEKEFLTLLSDYYLIPNDIENFEQFGKHIEIEFKSHLKNFLKKQNLSELAISIDLISIFYNYKLKNNLIHATKHYIDVLYDIENYQDRLSFFDNLYEMEVLKGGILKSYYECVNCSPNTFEGILTLNVKPSKLNLTCPSCFNELLYIAPYELNKEVYDKIVHKDGLLFFAIKYLFEQNNIKYIPNYLFKPDIEFDFCITNDEDHILKIVEIKMFKTDRPTYIQIGNIKDSILQMKKSIDKLLHSNINFKDTRKIIVTNLPNNDVYKKAKIDNEKDLLEYNIEIISIYEFEINLIRK